MESSVTRALSSADIDALLAPAGDWLVRNPTGECWPITDSVFRSRYVAG